MTDRDRHDPDTPEESESQGEVEPETEQDTRDSEESRTEESRSRPDVNTEELVVGGDPSSAASGGSDRPYGLIIGVIIVLIIIIAVLWYFLRGSDTAPEPQPQPAASTEATRQDASGGQVAGEPAGQPGGGSNQALTLNISNEVEEWSPADFQLPPPQKVSDVEKALKQAQTYMESGNLVKPEGENALAAYLSVLEKDPGNEQAKAGIDKIASRLVDRANQAVAEGRLSDALELISAIEAIRPDLPGLKDLQERVQGQEEVINLLAAAAEDIDAGNLVKPEGDNAVAKYRQVLEMDPGNADAQQGLENVELQLLEMATAAAQEYNFDRARELLNRAAGVREGAGTVPEVRQNIQTFRQQRYAQLVADARAAIEADNYAEAGQLIAQAEAIAPPGARLSALKQDLARARVYSQYQPGDTFRDAFQAGPGYGPVMVVMPIGSFMMGSPPGALGHKSYEGPVHKVTFTDAFAVSQTEITVDQFRRFVQATGYVTDAEQDGESNIYSQDSGQMISQSGVSWRDNFHCDKAGGNMPVIHVSWNDAKAYVEWLSEQTGQPYRLLTEAEFEYALRAGTRTPYWWGTGSPEEVVENLTGEDDRADSGRRWTTYFEDYEDDYWGPAPVASFIPNPFGLYDMAGNVSEWVKDCWHDSYARAPSDGSAWVNPGCDKRVIRGGSWISPPLRARSASRISASPDTHTARVGFRVARDL